MTRLPKNMIKFSLKNVLKAIKQEKHRRMELVYESITNSIEKMAERLHNVLIETNEEENRMEEIYKILKIEEEQNTKLFNSDFN